MIRTKPACDLTDPVLARLLGQHHVCYGLARFEASEVLARGRRTRRGGRRPARRSRCVRQAVRDHRTPRTAAAARAIHLASTGVACVSLLVTPSVRQPAARRAASVACRASAGGVVVDVQDVDVEVFLVECVIGRHQAGDHRTQGGVLDDRSEGRGRQQAGRRQTDVSLLDRAFVVPDAGTRASLGAVQPGDVNAERSAPQTSMPWAISADVCVSATGPGITRAPRCFGGGAARWPRVRPLVRRRVGALSHPVQQSRPGRRS